MNEHLKALSFYRRMQDALRTTGVDAVILTLDKDGEMQADAVYPPVKSGKSLEIIKLLLGKVAEEKK